MITITVLIILGIPTAYFGYPKLKEYKFYKFKKTALAALQSDDLQTALLTSQAAYLLNREDFPNLKTLVESAEKLNHPTVFRVVKNISEPSRGRCQGSWKLLKRITSPSMAF